jgi:hypothetical protein
MSVAAAAQPPFDDMWQRSDRSDRPERRPGFGRQDEPDSVAKQRHEQVQARKIGYLTAELSLTTAEAQAFWPIYNECWEKRNKLFAERHNLMRKIEHDHMDDKKTLQVVQRLLETMQDDAKLSLEYNDKLAKVLAPQKLAKYYVAEEMFKMRLIDVMRRPEKQ